MLEEKFKLPVFINNDGDLYAYGEAIAGFLTFVNGLLDKAGSPKLDKNVLGLTLGTGFGAGIARDGNLFLGDNSIAEEMNSSYDKPDGSGLRRLIAKVYNLEDAAQLQKFLRGSTKEIAVPGSDKKVKYDQEMRIGICISKIGTSKAISIGAYAFALSAVDKKG